MLQNPDIQPPAGINQWILLILMFHFTLVYVKGAVHGPDGLSHRLHQFNNLKEDGDDEFEDWIDELHVVFEGLVYRTEKMTETRLNWTD